MTGFGKSVVGNEELSLTVEVRSVNSRFLDYTSRLPGFMTQFDHIANRVIKNKCERGRVTLSVSVDFNGSLTSIPKLNIELLGKYRKLVSQAAEQTGTEPEIPLETYLTFPEVLNLESGLSDETLQVLFSEGLDKALGELCEMRKTEGEFLAEDLAQRIEHVAKKVDEVFELSLIHQPRSVEKLKARVTELIDGKEVDENRLYTEISIMSGKIDITEELTRLKSHIELFRSYFNCESYAGKKMNFLLQEMGREINTIGSKTDVLDILHIAVDIKNELEKIREQVQNIL